MTRARQARRLVCIILAGAATAAALRAVAVARMRAPDFTLKTLDGNSVRLADLRGKVVVLNFWAYWWGYCRGEFPTKQRVAEELEGRAVFVGIVRREANDPDWKKTEEAVRDYDLRKWPIALDESSQVSLAYGARALPTTVIIDRNGILRCRISGATDEKELRDELKLVGARFPANAAVPPSGEEHSKR